MFNVRRCVRVLEVALLFVIAFPGFKPKTTWNEDNVVENTSDSYALVELDDLISSGETQWCSQNASSALPTRYADNFVRLQSPAKAKRTAVGSGSYHEMYINLRTSLISFILTIEKIERKIGLTTYHVDSEARLYNGEKFQNFYTGAYDEEFQNYYTKFDVVIIRFLLSRFSAIKNSPVEATGLRQGSKFTWYPVRSPLEAQKAREALHRERKLISSAQVVLELAFWFAALLIFPFVAMYACDFLEGRPVFPPDLVKSAQKMMMWHLPQRALL